MSQIPSNCSAPSDEAEIRRLIAKWSAALEKKDVDGLLADYAPDVLLYDLKPPYEIRGVEAFRKLWQDCLPFFPDAFASEHHGMTITVSGDIAFAHGLHHITPLAGDHPAGRTWMRVTACYRKTNGAWQVAHEHVSLPFDPRSGQAVLIATPEIPEG